MDYFDRNAYLAQSPQFYKQMAMAAGFERIFETGPVFRAEKSYTNKHSTEFSGFDLEFSYITSYKDVMKMEEELLTAGLQAVKDNYGDPDQGDVRAGSHRSHHSVPGGQAGRPVQGSGRRVRLHRR